MAPAPFLPGLGLIGTPAPASSDAASPSTAGLGQATLHQRYELLHQYDKEKTEFISVSATGASLASSLIPIGTALAL